MLNLFNKKEDYLEEEYLYEQLTNLRGYLHEVEHSEMHDPYRKEELIAELTADIINLEEYIFDRHHEREMRPFIYTFYAMITICLVGLIIFVLLTSFNS